MARRNPSSPNMASAHRSCLRSPSVTLRLVEQPHIGVVAEAAVAGLAGDLSEDAHLDQALNQLIGRGVGRSSQSTHFFYGSDRTLEEMLKHAMAVAGGIAEVFGDQVAM